MQRSEETYGNQALPFAPCYAPPAAAAAAAMPPTAATAPASGAPTAAGICIIRKADGAPDVSLDVSVLQQAGLKTRQSASCIPDLIVTTPTLPAPLAIMLVTSANPAHSLDDPPFMHRCGSMVGSFRICALALPHVLGSHPTVLQLACAPRYQGKLLLHYMCPGDSPANTVLQLISCCSNGPEAAQQGAEGWNKVVAAATEQAAIDACLHALMAAAS